MIDRRLFCLGTTASIAVSARGVAATVPATSTTVADAAFYRLLERFYAAVLDENPMLVTSLGIDSGPRRAAKSRLVDESLAGVARRKRMLAGQVAALRGIDRAQLGPAAAIDYDAVRYDDQLNDAAARRFAYGGVGAGSPYVVSQQGGAYAGVPDFLDSEHVIATASDCEAYLARLDAFAGVMDQEVERIRHDAGLGVVPPDFAIDGAIAQMKVLRQPAASSSLVTSLVDRARAKAIAGDWQARASTIYDRRVVPALDRQMALLASLRPTAVHDAGVWRLPDGEAYYAASLRAETTTDLSPDEVHRIGLEVTRTLTERADTLFRRIGMAGGTVAERYGALFKDPRYLYPNTDAGKAKEIADLNALVVAMQRRLPAYFHTLPRTPLEIRRIPPATEAGASTHYTSGSLDGTRPGIYWLNLRDTAEAPFWDMPTTTFHEGIPGHHLQGTLQLQSDLPAYRKIQSFGAYVEGWALYAEQLADEMGFYADHPAWELGYIHDALLRSGRMVVDTGIHALRWSREKAVATLSGIDGDPLALSGQEIERYAVGPGQACSYMVGKTTILRLRAKAQAALGSDFNLGRFHDAILLSGSLPLAVLEAKVDAFIAAGGRSGRA